MKCSTAALLMLFAGLPLQLASVARAQTAQAAAAANTSAADGQRNPDGVIPALTGVRHSLYRLHKSYVVEVKFTFSPEFDQTATVQPDGFVALKGSEEVFAEGLTVSELRDAVRDAYALVLRDPEVSVILTDFEKPYFLAWTSGASWQVRSAVAHRRGCCHSHRRWFHRAVQTFPSRAVSQCTQS